LITAVDAAIDHEAGRHDRGVAPRLGEDLRMQGDFERARHLEDVDGRTRDVPRLGLDEECGLAFHHHLAMPGGLHEGDPLRLGEARMRPRGWVCGLGVLGVLQHLIHGFPLVETRIRAHGTRQPALSKRKRWHRDRSLSSGL
jgi:hypothetical protein